MSFPLRFLFFFFFLSVKVTANFGWVIQTQWLRGGDEFCVMLTDLPENAPTLTWCLQFRLGCDVLYIELLMYNNAFDIGMIKERMISILVFTRFIKEFIDIKRFTASPQTSITGVKYSPPLTLCPRLSRCSKSSHHGDLIEQSTACQNWLMAFLASSACDCPPNRSRQILAMRSLFGRACGSLIYHLQ